MLLAATDMASASADSVLCVELAPFFTVVVMMYFLIVMVRFTVVWVGIYSYRLGLGDFALKRDSLWVNFNVIHNGKFENCVFD